MPKTEKETKKDVTSMQQEIKRRNKTSPGTPTDIGTWEGSTETKYRWLSHLSPIYALGFFSGLAINVSTSKLLIVLHLLELMPQLSLKLTKILTQTIEFVGYSIILPMKVETESLTLVDEVSTQSS